MTSLTTRIFGLFSGLFFMLVALWSGETTPTPTVALAAVLLLIFIVPSRPLQSKNAKRIANAVLGIGVAVGLLLYVRGLIEAMQDKGEVLTNLIVALLNPPLLVALATIVMCLAELNGFGSVLGRKRRPNQAL